MKKSEFKELIKEVITELKSSDYELHDREVYIHEIVSSITRKIRQIKRGDEDYIPQNINLYISILGQCDELKTEISRVLEELKNR